MELLFKLLKNKEGEAVGFSLLAGAEERSQKFVESFCESIREFRARGAIAVEIGRRSITFLNLNEPPYTMPIGDRNAEALKELLKNPDRLGLYDEPNFLGTGVRLVLHEYSDTGEDYVRNHT